ncbi:SagB/ThcOx family dehydrogenase [bacterium]|nr:SagB/ThcOx family dehydrogenase [candidate division CSSED10-310 bacterium]
MWKRYPDGAPLVDLVPYEKLSVGRNPLLDLVIARKSRRRYLDQALSLEELSFLVFAGQGATNMYRDRNGVVTRADRTFPSAGGRYPFETYLLVQRVEGLKPGLYHYQPLRHGISLLNEDPGLPERLVAACCGQRFIADAGVVFIWTALPYRTEWRYMEYGEKFVALDAGHLCQNVYLAAEAIEAGACAIGAYFQERVDELLPIDGVEEFTVYLAPVGKVRAVPKVMVKTAVLERLAGTYVLDFPEGEGRKLCIALRGNVLSLEPEGADPHELTAESETVFHLKGIEDIRIIFECDEQGKAIGLILDQAGKMANARRLKV